MVQLLLFSVGDIRGAIPLPITSRVIRMVQPTMKSGAHTPETGSIVLHGKEIRVICLHALFGMPVPRPRLTDMLIIAHAGKEEIALWVDATSGVQDIPHSTDYSASQKNDESDLPGARMTSEGLYLITDLSRFIASGIPSHEPGLGARSRNSGATVRFSEEPPADPDVIDTLDLNTVLEERAKKIAQPESEVTDTKKIEVLRFRLAYREYAIEMRYIREVILTGKITPVPGTPDYISGICVVRGEIISLVDLRALLSIPEKGLTDLNRVIVLSDRMLTFGVLADHITGIGTIDLNQISLPDTGDCPVADTYVKGVAPGSLVVIDTATIFADPKMIVNET